jgi:hypothetical protein
MSFHALTRVRFHQDDAILTEGDALDFDECPLEIVPSEGGHPFWPTAEGTAVVVPKFT